MLRRQAALDRKLELARADSRLHDILRLGAYQLRAQARVPAYAAVSTSVDLAREAIGEDAARYVNQALRRLIRETRNGTRETSEGTHPRWLVARWRRSFGAAESARLVSWNDTRPALTIQPARWSKEVLARALREAGFGVEDAPYDAGLRVTHGDHASRLPFPVHLPGFAEGGFVVQDAAHALVCRYAGLAPGAVCGSPRGARHKPHARTASTATNTNAHTAKVTHHSSAM